MVPSKPPSVIKENAAREHVGRVLPAGAPIPTERHGPGRRLLGRNRSVRVEVFRQLASWAFAAVMHRNSSSHSGFNTVVVGGDARISSNTAGNSLRPGGDRRLEQRFFQSGFLPGFRSRGYQY
jgi:hypothetical protein